MEMFETAGRPVKAWVDGVEFDAGARRQVENIASLPFIHDHVAVMPDVHVGKGATVGSVIPTIGAIVPAAVGVDIGCFTGDTEVVLADSKTYRLDELVDAGEIVVYACTVDGRIHGARAKANRTRRDAALVEVELDDSSRMRCTPDHLFMTRDGTYREAALLEPGHSLMPFYSKVDHEGYYRVQQPNSGKFQRAHWLMARSGLLGELPSFAGQRTVIHHRNFDEADNRPENLEFMAAAAHAAYHRGLVERNKHWHSTAFEAARKAALSAKAKTPGGRCYFAARGTANLKTYMRDHPDHFSAAVAGNGKRGREFLERYNRSERGRAKSKEIAGRKHSCPECGEQVKSYIGLYNHRRSLHGVLRIIRYSVSERWKSARMSTASMFRASITLHSPQECSFTTAA